MGDPVFRGIYHGRVGHNDDLAEVIQRSLDVGCDKLMITGSSLSESRAAVQLAESHPGVCYATVGVHPCSTKDFAKHPKGPDACLAALRKLAIQAKEAGTCVAFGEIGLDWDRLFLSPRATQIEFFEKQLDLAIELDLPLFLHSRSCHDEFEAIIRPRLDRLPRRGLVHSFTGTVDEMNKLLDLGFDIGINGCSMKTEENLEVVKAVPLERLHVETDGPWCEIRPSHASAKYLDGAPTLPKAVKKEKWAPGLMVKGRNEPCTIPLVAHVIARVKEVPVEEVCEAAWRNSIRMFELGETTQKQENSPTQ